MNNGDRPEKIRILGVIGLRCSGAMEPVERVMRLENLMLIEPAHLPVDYPFADYEKCEVFRLQNKGTFTDILIFERFNRVPERAIELSRIMNDRVFAFQATGKAPDWLKVYERGRIVIKLGPDDDDESGLMVAQTMDKDAKRLFKGMDVDGKFDTPWHAALALGVPEIARAKEAAYLPDIKKFVFLSMDSPIA